MYIAENYYKRFNSDGGVLEFEKDGSISKLKQYDYKVSKLIKK